MGRVERKHRYILNVVHALSLQAYLPSQFRGNVLKPLFISLIELLLPLFKIKLLRKFFSLNLWIFLICKFFVICVMHTFAQITNFNLVVCVVFLWDILFEKMDKIYLISTHINFFVSRDVQFLNPNFSFSTYSTDSSSQIAFDFLNSSAGPTYSLFDDFLGPLLQPIENLRTSLPISSSWSSIHCAFSFSPDPSSQHGPVICGSLLATHPLLPLPHIKIIKIFLQLLVFLNLAEVNDLDILLQNSVILFAIMWELPQLCALPLFLPPLQVHVPILLHIIFLMKNSLHPIRLLLQRLLLISNLPVL